MQCLYEKRGPNAYCEFSGYLLILHAPTMDCYCAPVSSTAWSFRYDCTNPFILFQERHTPPCFCSCYVPYPCNPTWDPPISVSLTIIHVLVSAWLTLPECLHRASSYIGSLPIPTNAFCLSLSVQTPTSPQNKTNTMSSRLAINTRFSLLLQSSIHKCGVRNHDPEI